MSARLDSAATVVRPMATASLDGVLALENTVYPFPWTRGNFVDSLAAGYVAWTLCRPSGELIGYLVALSGVAEMHLLNITVAPGERRHGHARRLLGALVQECRAQGAARLWLEVRVSNGQARQTYLDLGFVPVGVRKGYYPAPGGEREDALVMSLAVDPAEGSDALE